MCSVSIIIRILILILRIFIIRIIVIILIIIIIVVIAHGGTNQRRYHEAQQGPGQRSEWTTDKAEEALTGREETGGHRKR
jgi:hypothetical protein